MTVEPTPVVFWLRDVRRCAEDNELVYMVGSFDPPVLPPLASDALATSRAWWSEQAATWIVRTADALLLLTAAGEVTLTRAVSQANALAALERLVASPMKTLLANA